MVAGSAPAQNNPTVGIAFILLGMLCISINDMLIKQLSGAYPLHQTRVANKSDPKPQFN